MLGDAEEHVSVCTLARHSPWRQLHGKICLCFLCVFFFFQAEDGIRDYKVTGVQTCALPIYISSETRLREALMDLQFANVMFYPVDMSRLLSTLSAKPDPGRQDNLPPAMHPMPSAVPATPTSVAQMYGIGGGGRAEFIPMMVEIFKDVKAIFKDNPVEAFTKGTGGTEYT